MCSSFMRANPQYSVTQNLKILEAGRHLWKSRSPAPSVKEGLPRPGCSGLPPVRSRESPRTETPKLLWQPVPAFYHSQSKNAFSMFNWNFQYFSLYPLPLIFFEYHWNITSIRIKKFWWEETFLGWFGSYIIAQISAPEKWMEDGWKTCWNCWSNFRWL